MNARSPASAKLLFSTKCVPCISMLLGWFSTRISRVTLVFCLAFFMRRLWRHVSDKLHWLNIHDWSQNLMLCSAVVMPLRSVTRLPQKIVNLHLQGTRHCSSHICIQEIFENGEQFMSLPVVVGLEVREILASMPILMYMRLCVLDLNFAKSSHRCQY